jgi:hypothetical protein
LDPPCRPSRRNSSNWARYKTSKLLDFDPRAVAEAELPVDRHLLTLLEA